MPALDPGALMRKFSSSPRNAACLRGSFYKLNVVKGCRWTTLSSKNVPKRRRFPARITPNESVDQIATASVKEVITEDKKMGKCLGFLRTKGKPSKYFMEF